MGTGALFRVALKKMQVYLQHAARCLTPRNNGLVESLDWFKGKFTGNHGFYHQI